ncbi:MAG TPA: hypothetical protein PLI53_02145 [Geobacteraceae bacterium]|nr:hypothetical protein [Geobacteraceae bacterium]
MKKGTLLVISCVFVFFRLSGIAPAAYHHMGESDAPKFLATYPDKAGTKLDNCVLCHRGGTYIQANGRKVVLGSCQWCHHAYGYDGSGNLEATLNPFGRAYRDKGRSMAALRTIENQDSDGDGYANLEEIAAVRYPGDPNDDPAKVTASYRIFTREQLLAMPQHTQFLLMNTAKAVDAYARFSGVVMEQLLERAGIDTSAAKITVYSPDGFSQGHPLEPDDSSDPYVKGTYPAATYYYDRVADKDKNPRGWCDYHSPSARGRSHGDPISVAGGLKLLLALRAEGKDLVPGSLGPNNVLKRGSQGPFALVAPQKNPGPPDQPSNASNRDLIWPFDPSFDHNGGFSTKCATIIKVEPLPAGTTDIDATEAGWSYIEQEKIIVYGALQGPKPVAPRNGTVDVAWNPVRFCWENSPSAEPTDVVSYRLEYTSVDPSLGQWKSKLVTKNSPEGNSRARGVGFALFAACGMVVAAGTKGKVRSIVVILLLVLLGTVFMTKAGGTADSVKATSPVREETSLILQPNTAYHWRVRDLDKNGGTTMSPVFRFTTGK